MPISVDSSSSSLTETDYHGTGSAPNPASAQSNCSLALNNKDVMPLYESFGEEPQGVYFPSSDHPQPFLLRYHHPPSSSEQIQSRFSPSARRSPTYEFRDGLRRRQVVENPNGVAQYPSLRKSESPIRKRARTMSSSQKHNCAVALSDDGASCSGPIYPLQSSMPVAEFPEAPSSIDSDLEQLDYPFQRSAPLHSQMKLHKYDNQHACSPPRQEDSVFRQSGTLEERMYAEQDIARPPVNDRVPPAHPQSTQSDIPAQANQSAHEICRHSGSEEDQQDDFMVDIAPSHDPNQVVQPQEHLPPSVTNRNAVTVVMDCQNRHRNPAEVPRHSAYSRMRGFPHGTNHSRYQPNGFHPPSSSRRVPQIQYIPQAPVSSGAVVYSCSSDPRIGPATTQYNYTMRHRPAMSFSEYRNSHVQTVNSSPTSRACTSWAPRSNRHIAATQPPGNTLPTTLCAAVPMPYLSPPHHYNSAVYGPQPQSRLSYYHHAIPQHRRHQFSIPPAVAGQYAQPQIHNQPIHTYPQHPMHHQPAQIDRHPSALAAGAALPQSLAPHLPTAGHYPLSLTAAAYLQTMAGHPPQPIHPAVTLDRRYLSTMENQVDQFRHNRRIPPTQNNHAAAMAAIQAPLLTHWQMHSTPSLTHPRIITIQHPISPGFVFNPMSYMLPVLTDDAADTYETFLNLTEQLGDGKPQGLSKNQIEHLVSYRYKPDCHKGDQTICVVCMCEWEPKQLMRVLPCHHEFHAKCVDKWLKSNRTCPICRADASKNSRSARKITNI